MIDYSRFRLSLKRLQEQHENYCRADFFSLSDLNREAIAESVLQRFETCYGCIWKVLKRHLTDRLGVPDTPNSPKPVFRLAFENHLMDAPVERWLRYADARTGTSHDYDWREGEGMPRPDARVRRRCRPPLPDPDRGAMGGPTIDITAPQREIVLGRMALAGHGHLGLRLVGAGDVPAAVGPRSGRVRHAGAERPDRCAAGGVRGEQPAFPCRSSCRAKCRSRFGAGSSRSMR